MFHKSFIDDRLYTTAFLISVVFHVIVLVILPGLKLLEPVETEDWLEVDLFISAELDTALPEPAPSEGSDFGGDDDIARVGESIQLPSPPVWLPDRMKTVDTETAQLRLRIPSDHLPDRIGPGITIPGILDGHESDHAGLNDFEPTGQAPPSMPWRPSHQPIAHGDIPEEHDLQITGEVAHRTVVFRPPAPRAVTAAGTGMVMLTFRVEPDGTIGRIVPVIRTHPELEQIAISYLEKWRFEAVSDSVGTQTGTITIRFRFQS